MTTGIDMAETDDPGRVRDLTAALPSAPALNLNFRIPGRPRPQSNILDQDLGSAFDRRSIRDRDVISADWCTSDLPMSEKPSFRPQKPRASGDEHRPASRRDERARLAIILPRHRLWEWHHQLLLHLRKTYDVAVFLDDRAAPYGRAERLWLRFEQLIFPGGKLAKPIAPNEAWRPVTDLDNAVDTVVINLSERPQPYSGAFELRYGDALDSGALIKRLLSRKAPSLAVHCPDQNRTLATSRLAIEDKFSIGRGLQDSFSRCLSLIDRTLSSADGRFANETTAVTTPTSATLAEFIFRMIAHKASNLIMKPFRHEEHWQVALRDGARSFNVIEDDGDRFYADPFLYQANGRTFLFVEEYPYADRRGFISAAEVVDGRLVAAPAAVLKRPYHLSYPFVFEHHGEFWMIPETGENRTIELYRAIEFPWKWELSKVLMEGAAFSDATVLFYDGLWWLFVTADWFGTSTQDELSIYYSETLDGEWKPHRANPVKSDSRFARPAGRIIRQGGRLFRPAQNCDRTYGAGIVWFEITELTPTRFSERKIADWDGRAELSTDGLHSFDQLGQLQAIDFKGSVYRGVARKNITAITPRHGGELERSLSKSSLFFDEIGSDRSGPQ